MSTSTDDKSVDGIAGQRRGEPASDVPFAVGSVVAGKYRVERVLGEGGLGTVVLAHHLELERPVAIKYLQPKALASVAIVDRFIREARLAAMLRSEHIIRVHDVARLEGGAPYIVMEYLEGKDLSDVLVDGPPPRDVAVDYILQACEGLADAHARGVIHRDLKPANLFLARRPGGRDTLKVLDFGISKLSERVAATGSYKKLTTDTDRFGTPSYMPPEQLSSAQNADARSDIWALGVVLYELLAGSLPFAGETLTELCVAIGTQDPKPLANFRADVPAELETVIRKCLEKEPDDRFRNVAELAQELGPFATAKGRALVESIAETVREAGASVRPPLSSSEFMLLTRSTISTPLKAIVVPASSGTNAAPTAWTDTGTDTQIELGLGKRRRPPVLALAAAAAALLVAVAGVMVLRPSSPPAAAQPGSVQTPGTAALNEQASTAAAAAPSATASTPPVAPAPTEKPAATASSKRGAHAAPAVAKQAASAASTSTPATTPVATASASPSPPPSASPSDARRSQFGERK